MKDKGTNTNRQHPASAADDRGDRRPREDENGGMKRKVPLNVTTNPQDRVDSIESTPLGAHEQDARTWDAADRTSESEAAERRLRAEPPDVDAGEDELEHDRREDELENDRHQGGQGMSQGRGANPGQTHRH